MILSRTHLNIVSVLSLFVISGCVCTNPTHLEYDKNFPLSAEQKAISRLNIFDGADCPSGKYMLVFENMGVSHVYGEWANTREFGCVDYDPGHQPGHGERTYTVEQIEQETLIMGNTYNILP